ncbi:alsin-like [Penaeus monodon]|uniref:alsin-like n=1 Tax=Penaeus monodon TaxID=6687 RepID=UPI0018A760ED|nr:alsin-like [Penaeus monodon]
MRKKEKEEKEVVETERSGEEEGEDELVTRRLDYLLGRQVIGVAAGRGFSLALVDPLDPPDPSEGTPLADHPQTLAGRGSPCRLCSPGTTMPEGLDNDGDGDGGARDRCPLGLSLSPRKEKGPGGAARKEGRKDATGSTLSHTSDPKRRKNYSEGSEFEIVECDDIDGDEAGVRELTKEVKTEQEKEGDGSGRTAKEEKGGGGGTAAANSLFINADAARQFISRQLSWMTSAQETRDNESEQGKDEKKEDERVTTKEEEDREEEETVPSVAAPTTPRKYADAATELIRENVASAATLVVSGVRTVGHKVGHRVGRLSRHFSGASAEGVVEGQEENDDDPPEELAPSEEALALTTLVPAAEALDQEGQAAAEAVTSPPRDASSVAGAASSGTQSLPRRLRDRGMERARGAHVRTASAGGAFPFLRGRAAGRARTPTPEEVVAEGKRALGTEVWAWGSSYKGQLGTGDLRALRPTPTCLYTLNHLGVAQVVCGDAHSAARTLDGQVYVWGDTSSDQLGPPPPPPLPLSSPSPSLRRRSSPYPSPSSNRRSSPVSSSSSNSSATSSFCSISPHSQGIKYPQRLRLPSEEEEEEEEEEVEEDDKIEAEEDKEEKEGERTGEERRKDERETAKKFIKQDEWRKRTEVRQERKRRKREVRRGEELAVDIAAGKDFLLIATITGRLLYVGALRLGPAAATPIGAGMVPASGVKQARVGSLASEVEVRQDRQHGSEL